MAGRKELNGQWLGVACAEAELLAQADFRALQQRRSMLFTSHTAKPTQNQQTWPVMKQLVTRSAWSPVERWCTSNLFVANDSLLLISFPLDHPSVDGTHGLYLRDKARLQSHNAINLQC
jgi:hypothetical protein